MQLETRVMPSGDIEVCAEEDGLRLCGFVSAWHLVDTKYNQCVEMLSGQLTTDRLEHAYQDEIEDAA